MSQKSEPLKLTGFGLFCKAVEEQGGSVSTIDNKPSPFFPDHRITKCLVYGDSGDLLHLCIVEEFGADGYEVYLSAPNETTKEMVQNLLS